MEIVTHVISDGSEQIQKFATIFKKTFSESFFRAAKSAVKMVIAITPPAHGSAGETGEKGNLDNGSQAKVRGFAAIERDMGKIFAPVKLKHKRKEAISAGEMISIHRRMLSSKRPGAPMRRDRAQPYYVDQRKFKQYITTLRSHVGRLAAGWMPAATRLSYSPPAWIARHPSPRGSVALIEEGSNYSLTAINNVSAHAPAWVAPEMQRRANKAQQYVINGLKRQIADKVAPNARAAGLSVG